MKREREVQAQQCRAGTTESKLWAARYPESHTLTWSHILKIIGWQRFLH